MGCGCSSQSNSNPQLYTPPPPSSPSLPKIGCTLTKEILEQWKAKLECVISNNKQADIGLSFRDENRYIGLIQSALNYPDDYCFFESQLNTFKLSILPKINNNVPLCN